MNFSEALEAMKAGKKIRHPTFEKDEYLMGCYLYNKAAHFDKFGNFKRNLTSEELKEAKMGGMSIVKMKGDLQHPDMFPHFKWDEPIPCGHDELHRYPQINLLLLIRDDWEVVE